MKTLEIDEMQRVIGGNTWVWKPNLSSIQIGGGNTCMDVYNTYGGDANYAASQLFASGSDWLVYTCMNWYTEGTDY